MPPRHNHDFTAEEWPFDDPPNTAAITYLELRMFAQGEMIVDGCRLRNAMLAELCRRWFLVSAFALVACSPEAPGSVSQDTQEAEEASPSDVSRLEDAIRRAMEWMATIDVHPIRLREEKGMKGIKHLVEYLDFHYLAYRASVDPQIKAASRKRAMDVLRVTEDGVYHNLASVDDRRFKQDSMSYLRACWLAEQFEFETTRYRREIEKVLPRIYRHLPTRGVDQRMGFALLFRQLGYSRPETEEQIYPESLIANHQPVSYYLRAPDRPYDLTHEVFDMTERGARSFPFPSPADERYAKGMVRRLLNHSMGQGNIDLTGEFLVNLVELGEARSAVAHEAREFIYRGQNRDGSFGNYEKEALAMRIRNPRYDVRIGGNLHTTMVCIWALVEMGASD